MSELHRFTLGSIKYKNMFISSSERFNLRSLLEAILGQLLWLIDT